MRLALKILNSDASLNTFTYLNQLSITRGETTNLVFQLCDKDQNMQRVMAGSSATVEISIPRSYVVAASPSGSTRTTTDYSIARTASPLNAGDRSIWFIALSADDTKTLISNSINVTLTDGANVSIASLNAAIRIQDNQD